MMNPLTTGHARLDQQLRFLVEIDRLKLVLRRTTTIDGTRHENSAEHSWHLTLMALMLAEHAAGPVALDRVIAMLMIHDLVEIDAGDTFAYDVAGLATKHERERRAAERIFGMLPADQAGALHALWHEFETAESADAQFANALDRLGGFLPNIHGAGGSWRDHGVSSAAVLRRMDPLRHSMPRLWPTIERLVAAGRDLGWFADAAPEPR
jgi:putative hydrolase of HD superfamily